MALQFNAESIFEIGIQIEKNGQQFYRDVAKRSSDSAIQELFDELADWEEQHVALFEDLKASLPNDMREDDLFDPESEFYAYLEAAANSHVFVASTDIPALAASCDSAVKALNLALAFEKDSVVYYTTMKKLVADHLGRDKIDKLIDEELKHIAILNSKKKHFAA